MSRPWDRRRLVTGYVWGEAGVVLSTSEERRTSVR